MRKTQAARAGALALSLLVALPTATNARATATPGHAPHLSVALRPEHLGKGTTMIFAFQIPTPDGRRLPPPLTRIDLLYPQNMGIVSSGLGIASCSVTALELRGPPGCPKNSLMGHGSASLAIPVGHEVLTEDGQLTIWMAPIENGHLGLTLLAEGQSPTLAIFMFPGVVLPTQAPYGGRLDVPIPLYEAWPDGPDAVVTRFRATIGPLGVTYLHHTGHTYTPYKPAGLTLPTVCPQHGFPFAAKFWFLDSTIQTAQTRVPCPTRHQADR